MVCMMMISASGCTYNCTGMWCCTQVFLSQAHVSWHPILKKALSHLSTDYLLSLTQTSSWLPGPGKLFAAFSQPLTHTQTILLGESPYPRALSANGYAFWDEAVGSIWRETGLSVAVNRATSFRNLIKMLLVARGALSEDCSQGAIAALDKTAYCQTASELFKHALAKGFLLLNACLVYEAGRVPYHAKQWSPFMRCLFSEVLKQHHDVTVLCFGKVAATIPEIHDFSCVVAPHPYNVSFIHHADVLAFFKPLDLLHDSFKC